MVTAKVVLCDPAAIVILAGTLARVGRLLDRLITAPPLGAAIVSVTVAVDVAPPATVVGFRVNDCNAAGAVVGALTVKLAVFVMPACVALILPIVVAVTAPVLTLKRTVVALAATVTDPGTVAAGFALVSDTTAPPAGAGADKVTVPLAD